MSNTVYIIVLVLLVAGSAFFSATEMAFSSVNMTKLKLMANDGNKKAKLVCDLLDEYDKLLSTILIGNNIVNIAMSSIATVMFVKMLGDGGATISTVVVTVVVLIFGEISPKSIAKDYPEKITMGAATAIHALIVILTSVNFLFTQWKKLLSKMFHLESDTKMSREELMLLVDEVEEGGSIDEEEGDLLRNAIDFTEQEAEDILTHRVDLEAVPLEATKAQIAEHFAESRFSRILVYKESIDNIVGVIHQKDFYVGHGITEKSIEEIITPVIFVMRHEKISSLLRQLQKANTHMAVVLDEYGGTYGIITMEDILEELVGEIWDEHDEVVDSFHKISDSVYRVDGNVDLHEVCDFFHVKTDSEMTSFSGWIMELMDHIPAVGESVEYMGLKIVVTAIESHRVVEAEITCEAAPEAEEGK